MQLHENGYYMKSPMYGFVVSAATLVVRLMRVKPSLFETGLSRSSHVDCVCEGGSEFVLPLTFTPQSSRGLLKSDHAPPNVHVQNQAPLTSA